MGSLLSCFFSLYISLNLLQLLPHYYQSVKSRLHWSNTKVCTKFDKKNIRPKHCLGDLNMVARALHVPTLNCILNLLQLDLLSWFFLDTLAIMHETH